jgi:hypothetical protein
LGPDHDHVCVAADELSLHEALSPRQREAAIGWDLIMIMFVLLLMN